MNFINRGFLSVTPKQGFWNWANTLDPDLQFSEEDPMEPTVYLITEDFFDEEPLIEQHFKKIFRNELKAICEEERRWPAVLAIDVFLEWFEIHIGSMVFDLEKTDLLSEKA
jgi:hypothetical protein